MEGKTFLDLINNFTILQQDFLGLAVYGINGSKSEMMLGVSGANAAKWRTNGDFAEIETFLREHGNDYYEQVREYFTRKGGMLDFGALQIASKILKWEELDDKEKGRVWTAYVFLKNQVKVKPDEEDYEAKVLKLKKS